MKGRTILLIGADPYVIRACQQLDVSAVVLESWAGHDRGSAMAPGCDLVLVDDVTSIEDILSGLRRASLHDKRFDGVLTTNELAVVTAAVSAEVLGASFCVSSQEAVAFRDKAVQKSIIRKAGIPTADSVVIQDIQRPDSYPPLPADQEFVIKPVAGGGTVDAAMIRSVADLHEFRKTNVSRNRSFILEEFQSGTEWNIDGIVQDGEPVAVWPGLYPNACLAAFSERRPMINLKLDPEVDADRCEMAESFAARCLRALGMQNGLFHLEAFHDEASGELSFGECGARRGGGFIQEMVHRKYGIDAALASLEIAIGLPLSQKPRLSPGVVGNVFLPTSPGTLMYAPGSAQIEQRPGVEHARVILPRGSEMTGRADAATRVGQALLCASDEQDLVKKVDALLAWFESDMIVAPPGSPAGHLWELQKRVEEKIRATELIPAASGFPWSPA